MAEGKTTRVKRTHIPYGHPAHGQYVKILNTTMYDIQELRKSVNNRIAALLRRDEPVCQAIAEELQLIVSDTITRLESEFERRAGTAVAKMPIMPWLEKVAGIGPRYSASLAAIIQDIERFPRISSIWAYFGMGLIPVCDQCGSIAYAGEARVRFCIHQADRRWRVYQTSKKYEDDLKKEKADDEESFKAEKYDKTETILCQHTKDKDFSSTLVAPQRRYFEGLLLTHNPFAKMTVWKISGQYVRQGKFYRMQYDKAKAKYVARDSGVIDDWIIDLRARRYVSKLFLSHLWEMWRKSLGLPAGKPWLMEQRGMDFKNHTYIPPPYSDIFDQKKRLVDVDGRESSR